jgi:hypothetical protein
VDQRDREANCGHAARRIHQAGAGLEREMQLEARLLA